MIGLQFYCRPMAFAVPVGQLTITTPALLPAAQGGVPYVQLLNATGGVPPYSWSLLSSTGGDVWVVTSLGNNQGQISGTPGQAFRVTNTGAFRTTNTGANRVT